MILLLDTCTFLWLIVGSAELSPAALAAIRDPGNRVFLSTISVWEIMLKHRIRRLFLDEPPRVLVPWQRELHRIEALPLEEAAAVQLETLPRLHRDPFDQMLVCQAIAAGMAIVTPDDAVRQYPVRTIW